jgi:hypothetical protein
MAGLGLNWQDFMRRPEVKVLLEEQGMVAVKQRYFQEQNKLMWSDPVIIQENNSPGLAVTNNVSADGGSTQYITGHTAHVHRFKYILGDDNMIDSNALTGSNWGIYINTLSNDGLPAFDANHESLRKRILLAFVTGSEMADLGGLSTTNVDCVVTASVTTFTALGYGIAESGSITASIGGAFGDAVQNQSATATVGGFANTIAPSSLITFASSSVLGIGQYTISNVNKGSVRDNEALSSVFADGVVNTNFTSADGTIGTGSIDTLTVGNDTFYNDPGAQVFNANVGPYNHLPKK